MKRAVMHWFGTVRVRDLSKYNTAVSSTGEGAMGVTVQRLLCPLAWEELNLLLSPGLFLGSTHLIR